MVRDTKGFAGEVRATIVRAKLTSGDVLNRFWRRVRWPAAGLAIWWVIAWLAAQALIVEGQHYGNAEVIVVLSGSSAYVERTHHAAELFREARGEKVVLTNDGQQGSWSRQQQRNLYTFERATEELKKSGVPGDKIILLPETVSSTYEEAALLQNWATRNHLKSLLVVTSGYHSRRARWTFERVFRNTNVAITLDSVPPGQQLPSPATWWWYPRGWRSVGAEYVKIIYYWLSYR